MPEQIGVAIIGSGIFVQDKHLPAVLEAPNISLRAIYSRSFASAKSTAKSISGVELYSSDSGEGKDYEDLLARNDVQAVIIALPIPHQPDFIRSALLAGKHVLSEKPIAKDMATAKDLLQWYHQNIDTKTVTWSVAENFRFLDSFLYGAEKVKDLGRILGFRSRVNSLVKPGGKYFETAWRKIPEYQGGFLLDGGIHFVAATRLLLSSQTTISRISAFTAQLQPHLPPIDDLNAVLQTASGISGTLSVSFGTTFTGFEYAVACEKGTVTVGRGKVIVIKENSEPETKDFEEDGYGVKPEVKAWAEGIAQGRQDSRQIPEEALKDLEILESMLKSGENSGTPIELTLQA